MKLWIFFLTFIPLLGNADEVTNIVNIQQSSSCLQFPKHLKECHPASCQLERSENSKKTGYEFWVVGMKKKHCILGVSVHPEGELNPVKISCLFNKMQRRHLSLELSLSLPQSQFKIERTPCDDKRQECSIRVGNKTFLDVIRLGLIHKQCKTI